MHTVSVRLLLVLLLSVSSLVLAQQRDRQQHEPARCVGKLKGIAPGVIQVETDKGERWLVAVEAKPQDISFQGTATPAFVQPGMLVQFSAAIDKKGEAQEKISQLKVITQRMGVQVGLQAEGGFAGGELFASNDDDSKKKKKPRGDSSPYTVTGAVRSIKDGKMYVAAGAVVKAELADNCQVSFDISDYRLAREGDSVEVEGWRYANQATQIYARRLTITAEKTLGADEKKRRPTAKTDDKKSDDKKTEEKKEGAATKTDGKKEKSKDAEKDKAAKDKSDK